MCHELMFNSQDRKHLDFALAVDSNIEFFDCNRNGFTLAVSLVHILASGQLVTTLNFTAASIRTTSCPRPGLGSARAICS